MTGPMTVVSFGFAVHATLGGVEPGTVPEEPQVLGRFLAVELGAAAGFAVGAQAAQGGDVAGVAVGRGGQRRVRGGDRDVAEGGAGRELGASAGDGLRRGGDRGRGGFPLTPGGLAGLLVRQLAGSPLPPGGLAGPGLRLAGLVPAAFLQLGRGQDLARSGQLARPAAQQVIGQVVIAQARDPPDRLLRRGDVDPRPLVPRASERPEYPLRAARRPFPGRGERVAPGQPRGHRDRDHARQAETARPAGPAGPAAGPASATRSQDRAGALERQ